MRDDIYSWVLTDSVMSKTGVSARRPSLGKTVACPVMCSSAGPAGKGAGAGLDVVFAVVAHPHRKVFQELAAVIFVDGALMVVLIIESDDHGGIFG
jgi:hypothetical protein